MKRSAGPFEILEILGEGSFGTVCVARVSTDPLRRKVALKILKGAYASNKKILNRTRDEARLLSRINHPNIVRVERLMEVGRRPVVVMEHVQGVSLDKLLLRFRDGLPAAIAIELIRQTFLALHVAYAEAIGEDGRPLRVIHRDIKPSNILLSIHGEVKVVDFGIAKGEFEGREAETESVVMGSRPYMAPERLDGISDSPGVDVYSSGMSLFELLTGRTMSLSINPVNHDQAMNRQLEYIKIPEMSDAAVEDLRNLIRRMCAYTRDYRPSALDCARDLEQLLYAIEPSQRIGPEEFARTTVLPVYESRPRIAPEDVLQDEGDNFFLEVTGSTPGKQQSSTASTITRYAPFLFIGALSFIVLVLGGTFALKLVMADSEPEDDEVVVTTLKEKGGMPVVNMWIPTDSQAFLYFTDDDPIFLPHAGQVMLKPGPTKLEIVFDNGKKVACPFNVTDGDAIRYVVDGSGKPGLSINDGEERPCTELQANNGEQPR